MVDNFVKLWNSILDSTVWCLDSDTRCVWITLLAMAKPDGLVHAAIPGIAKRAGVSLDKTIEAMELFQAPDPHSRSEEFEGRRIEQDGRDWRILNYKEHRRRQTIENERIRKREWWRKHKSKEAKLDAELAVASETRQKLGSNEIEIYNERKKNVRSRWPRTYLDSVHRSDAVELTDCLWEAIAKVKPDYAVFRNENTYKKWSIELEKMLRLDKRDPEQTKKVISWALNNSFWQSNILSASKLRAQYDRLEIQMSKPIPASAIPAPEITPAAHDEYKPNYDESGGADPEVVNDILGKADLPWRK